MGDKIEKKLFIELLLEYVTVNETEAFGISPNKGNRGHYFVHTLPFYKQSIHNSQKMYMYKPFQIPRIYRMNSHMN